MDVTSPAHSGRQRVKGASASEARSDGARAPTMSRKRLPACSVSRDAVDAEYPLERVCRHQYDPFQLNFARHALELFPEKDRRSFEATHRGLVLRVKTEAALEKAVMVLRGTLVTR